MGTASNILERIRRTADDLVTLEINTIIKDDMTCLKPPDDDRMVLYMLGKVYHYKLKELGSLYQQTITDAALEEYANSICNIEINGKPVTLNLFRGLVEFSGGGLFSFRELSARAGSAIRWIQNHSAKVSVAQEQQKLDIMVLSRIEGKSYEICRAIERLMKSKNRKVFDIYHDAFWKFDKDLKASNTTEFSVNRISEKQILLYQRLPPAYTKVLAERTKEEFLNPEDDGFVFEFDIRDKLLIRKSIDIGVEKVVLQTRISMDGDITTRISEKFADAPNQFVLNLHNSSTDMSVSFWNKLFDALVGFGKHFLK